MLTREIEHPPPIRLSSTLSLLIVLLLFSEVAASQQMLAPRPLNTYPLTEESGDYVGAGGANSDVELYSDGVMNIKSEVWSDSWRQGVYAFVYVILSDLRGRAIFVSPRFDLPTACSTADIGCSSHKTASFVHRISPDIARFTSRIMIHHGDRSQPDPTRRIVNNIDNGYRAFNDLPLPVRGAIGRWLESIE